MNLPDAPSLPDGLVEWLESLNPPRAFPIHPGLDGVIDFAVCSANEAGRRDVINMIRTERERQRGDTKNRSTI